MRSEQCMTQSGCSAAQVITLAVLWKLHSLVSLFIYLNSGAAEQPGVILEQTSNNHSNVIEIWATWENNTINDGYQRKSLPNVQKPFSLKHVNVFTHSTPTKIYDEKCEVGF